MTERKPPGTSWGTWIEAQIRVAKEQGAFDNLPGAGKPLPYLGLEYDPDWWVKQLVQREQIPILPPSLELLRKVDKELAAIEKLHDEATVRRRVSALNVEGPPTRLSILDVDQVVARWRRTRSANPSGSSPVSLPPKATRSANAMKSAVRASASPNRFGNIRLSWLGFPGRLEPKAAIRRMANYQPEGFTIEAQKFMISAVCSWSPTMTRFMFLVLERRRVVAPTSARPLAAPVPAL